MLQVDDGFLVFPVGLDNHALDGASDHTEGMGFFLNNAETLLTLQATALPLIVAQIDRFITDSQLGAQLSHLLAHGKHQRVEAGARHSRHGEEHMPIVERGAFEVGNLVSRARRVALVGDDDLRTLRKLGAILLELTVDNAIILDRITILKTARHIDDVHNQSSALNMAQKLMAQATALARTFDKAGNIGDNIGVLAGTYHTQVGHERGKRIVGDLGTGGTHARDE